MKWDQEETAIKIPKAIVYKAIQLPKLCLQCIAHPPLQLILSKQMGVVGRSTDCDYLISDISVSRRHAELQLTDVGLRLIDLQSRNGTFVNNQKINSYDLSVNQTIRFGAIDFVLRGRVFSPD